MDSASDSKASPTRPGTPSTTTSTRNPGNDPLTGLIRPEGFPDLPEGWSTEWETFPASDSSLQLFALVHRRSSPEEGAGHRALVVLHGYGEHGGRYIHVPHYVKDDIDLAYCLDLRGHGRSEGLRGHVDRFDLYAEDLAHGIERLRERLLRLHGRAEIHLLAHSMGGHIALRMLFLFPDIPIRSVTASAPFLDFERPVPVAKRLAGRALSHLWGTLQMESHVRPEDVSHDPAVIEAYRKDRLIHDKATPKFYTELVSAMKDTLKRDTGIHHPLQFIVPLQDRVVDSEKALAFFRALKHRDKRLRTYPTFFHESLNEIGKEQAFADVVDWIRESRKDGPRKETR